MNKVMSSREASVALRAFRNERNNSKKTIEVPCFVHLAPTIETPCFVMPSEAC